MKKSVWTKSERGKIIIIVIIYEKENNSVQKQKCQQQQQKVHWERRDSRFVDEEKKTEESVSYLVNLN